MLGRIVASQNSKQSAYDQHAWSYSLYDGLGRVYQAGQKRENPSGSTQFASIFGMQIGQSYNPATINYTNFEAWIAISADATLEQVTTTQYDEVLAAYGPVLPADFEQTHLRKRVTSVCYEEDYDGFDNTYDHATHYSYDIHGNVHTLLQDNPSLATIEQQFKRMEYTFDVISGNVHEFRYQPGEADQYTHRYTYDADNRIENVYTTKRADLIPFSNNSQQPSGEPTEQIWDHDAAYFYYDHAHWPE
jgi:hypothetical protein